MFKPTKSIGDEMIFKLVSGKFGGGLASIFEKSVGVFALEDHAQEARIHFAGRDLRGANVRGRIDRRQAGCDVLGRTDFGTRPP